MSVEKTLAERGERYGEFAVHAEIAQNLQDAMREAKGWDRLTPVGKQALTVIADKIARILSGDPCYADNWHDIQGYAKLVEDRLVDLSKDPIEQYADTLSEEHQQTVAERTMICCETCGSCAHLTKDCPIGQRPITPHEILEMVKLSDCQACGRKGGHGGLPCPNMRPYSSFEQGI